MTPGPEPFEFSLPTRIRFGPGTRRSVGQVASRHGARVALVTGRTVAEGAGGRDVESSLAEAGLQVVVRRVAQGEPGRAAVQALADQLRATAPACVVAVGGGSVLDLAKAAALVPTEERLGALLAGERAEEPGIPVVALPTTAGTGAEVSHAAIVHDEPAGRKRGVRGPGLAPRDAIVDPELVLGAPPEAIAAAGFDAVAHAVETSASRAASELTLQLAGIALPALLAAIPRLHADPADAEAARPAAYGAMLMGINLANSSTCLPHRLQYPLGGLTGTSHGAGVAALFPAWLARTVAVAPASLARLARAARLAPDDAPDAVAAAGLAAAVVDLLEAIELRAPLSALGVRREDVPELVARVEGSVANDPGPTTPEDLRDLYLASL